MPIKLKKKIGDKEENIEISIKEILEAVGNDKSLMMDLLDHHGIEFEDGKGDNKEISKKTDKESIIALKNEIKAVAKMVQDRYKSEDDAKAKSEKVNAETAMSKALDKAIKEGRIGKDDRAEYEKDYSGNLGYLEKTLKRLPADKSKAELNKNDLTNTDKTGNDKVGAGGKTKYSSGSNIFSAKEIGKMSLEEYAKNEAEIKIAMAAGNITE